MTYKQERMLLLSWKLMEEAWPLEKKGLIWLEYKTHFSMIMAAMLQTEVTEVQTVMIIDCFRSWKSVSLN